MKKYIIMAAVVLLILTVGLLAAHNFRNFRVELSGYEETPLTLSTTGEGTFKGRISRDHSQIEYELKYSDLEGTVTQAHIHIGNTGMSGGISVFLCSNLGNGPAGTQACPAQPATVTGTLSSVDVIGPTGQGITAGQFDELIKAMRNGSTYVNVHSTLYPTGEVRSQIDVNDRGGHH